MKEKGVGGSEAVMRNAHAWWPKVRDILASTPGVNCVCGMWKMISASGRAAPFLTSIVRLCLVSYTIERCIGQAGINRFQEEALEPLRLLSHPGALCFNECVAQVTGPAAAPHQWGQWPLARCTW